MSHHLAITFNLPQGELVNQSLQLMDPYKWQMNPVITIVNDLSINTAYLITKTN